METIILVIVLLGIAGGAYWFMVRKEAGAPGQAPAAPSETSVQPAEVFTDNILLRQIADHLRAIRSMLTFFTVLIVIGLVLQTCSVLLN